MIQCPACAQPVSPDQEKCSKCGIPLHHGVDTGSRSSGVAQSSGMVIAVVLVLVGLAVMVVLCGGGLFLFSARSVAVPAPASVPVSPIPTTVEVSEEPTLESQPVEREDSPMP